MVALLPLLPWGFRRRPRALTWLRVAAAGISLASVTGLVLGSALGVPPIAVQAPTLVVGCVWAALIGDETGKRRLWRWLASVPLAMLNAGVSCFVAQMASAEGFFWRSEDSIVVRFVEACFAGATLGVVIWGPALLVTLLFFGLPIETARIQSKDGLGGADRGDAYVGLVCAFFGLLTLGAARQPTPFGLLAPAWSVSAFAVTAVLAGSTVAAVTVARLMYRSWFLRQVERGQRADYRIVEAAEGRRHLTRVRVDGGAYRSAEVTESIYEIEDGREPIARVPV
jgi:hypothetical protein